MAVDLNDIDDDGDSWNLFKTHYVPDILGASYLSCLTAIAILRGRLFLRKLKHQN